MLRVLSYHREQESAETFGKGEALAVTLNYSLIKTNRPKIPKHTHKLSRMCTKKWLVHLLLQRMRCVQECWCWSQCPICNVSTTGKPENWPGSKKMPKPRKVTTITTQSGIKITQNYIAPPMINKTIYVLCIIKQLVTNGMCQLILMSFILYNFRPMFQ